MTPANFNLILMIIGFLGLSIFYLISLQPKKKSTTKGDKAWSQARNIRFLAFLFEILAIVAQIRWIYFPVQELNWEVHSNVWIGRIIGLILAIPMVIIMTIGVFHAGSESLSPKEGNSLYTGIYKYIRHPQALGEFPLFIAIGFMANSWFQVIILIVYNIIFLPIMVKVEEADLVRRYGDSYIIYQNQTGAFIPKRNLSADKITFYKNGKTVDAVILHNDQIALIKRKYPPFQNHWALPGGFIEPGETPEQAVIREVKEEIGLAISPIQQTGIYGKVGRDPRGYIVSKAFICKIMDDASKITGGSDADHAEFIDLKKLQSMELAFDHHDIIRDALKYRVKI